MTTAQQGIATLAAWTEASAAPMKNPVWGWTRPGPYCVWIPLELDTIPDDSGMHREHLPIWIPASQASTGTPTALADPTTAPVDQSRVEERLRHIVWRFQGEPCEFRGALVPLERGETLRTALDRAFPAGLDLDDMPVLFLPMWKLDVEPLPPHRPQRREHRQILANALPLLRG